MVHAPSPADLAEDFALLYENGLIAPTLQHCSSLLRILSGTRADQDAVRVLIEAVIARATAEFEAPIRAGAALIGVKPWLKYKKAKIEACKAAADELRLSKSTVEKHHHHREPCYLALAEATLRYVARSDASTAASAIAASFSSFTYVAPTSELALVLSSVSSLCRIRGRDMHTSDVLIALLEMASGRVMRCLDVVLDGGGVALLQTLAAAATAQRAQKGQAAQDWNDGYEMHVARHLAVADGQHSFNELYLLIGIIDGPSETADWLKCRLGDVNLAKLRNTAMEARRLRRNVTPGGLLPQAEKDNL